MSGITNLTAAYAFTTGNCHGGSLRWSIVTPGTNKSIFVYYGAAPNSTDCTTADQSTTNMVSLTDLRVDTSQVGGTFYDTWAHALTLAGSYAVTKVDLVLDSGWGGDQVLTLGNVAVNGNVWTPTGGGVGFTELHP